MQDMCSTCLSQNRTLKSLHLLRKEMNLEWLQVDFLRPSSALCWECVEDLRHADRFRQRAIMAQSALDGIGLLHSNQCEVPLKTLSTLSVSDICQESCVELDTTYILKKIKQNKHISVSTTQSNETTEKENRKIQIDVVKADNIETIPDIEQKIQSMLEKLSNVMKKDYVKLYSIVEVTEPHDNITEPDVNPDEPRAKKNKPASHQTESEDDEPHFNIMEPIIDIMEPITEITETVADEIVPESDITPSNNETCDDIEDDNLYNTSPQTKGWPVLTLGDPSMPKLKPISKLEFLRNVLSETANKGPKRKIIKKVLLHPNNVQQSTTNSQVTQTLRVTKNSQVNESPLVVTDKPFCKIAPKPISLLLPLQNNLADNSNDMSGQPDTSEAYVTSDLGKATIDLTNTSKPISLNENLTKVMAYNRLSLNKLQSIRKDAVQIGNKVQPMLLKRIAKPENITVTSASLKNSIASKNDQIRFLIPGKVTQSFKLNKKGVSKNTADKCEPRGYVETRITEEQMLSDRETSRNTPEYVSSEYKCESCIQPFSSRDQYSKHNQLNHSESSGPFMCAICATRFKREKSLKHHFRAHRLVYCCCYCPYRHQTERSVAQHVRDCHRGVHCRYCELVFRSQSQLSEHMLEAHMSSKELRRPAAMQCALCPLSFPSLTQLRAHYTSHPELSSIGVPRSLATATQKRISIFVCDLCGYKTANRVALVEHLTSAHARGHGTG